MSQINYEKKQNKIGIYNVQLTAFGGSITQNVLINTENITVNINNVSTGVWEITTSLPAGTIYGGTITSCIEPGGLFVNPPFISIYTPQTVGNAGNIYVFSNVGLSQNSFELLVFTLYIQL
jgi:hypothetical protein